MHVLLEKRQIVLAALVVMLGLAVFANWYFTGTKNELFPEGAGEQTESAGEAADGAALYTSAEEADYFAAAKLNRAAAHSEAMEELQAVMANAETDGDAAKAVQASMDELSRAVKRENDMETLISAALGGDCVAVVSDNSVDVVVSRNALTDGAVLQINDIIRKVCGTDYENVRISAALA